MDCHEDIKTSALSRNSKSWGISERKPIDVAETKKANKIVTSTAPSHASHSEHSLSDFDSPSLPGKHLPNSRA